MSIDARKMYLRQRARALRQQAHRAAASESASQLLANFIAAMAQMNFPKPGSVVAGYAAMGSEINAWPLLLHLCQLGYVCALPSAPVPDAPLTFQVWRPDGKQDGKQGPAATPQAALCPLLAFNQHGVRLGQGGGHYDRTLLALRQTGPLLAVGLAFDVQRMSELPSGANDQPLDWVITEKAVYNCGAAP